MNYTLHFSKKQTLDDAYAAPANFLEIDVINPITHGVAGKRYTDYEVRLKVKIYILYLTKQIKHFNADQSTCFPRQRVQCSEEIF